MIPDNRVTYENGNIQLILDQFYDPYRVNYWVANDIASMQMTEHELDDLRVLLQEWDGLMNRDPLRYSLFIVGVLVGMVFCMVMVLIFGG